MSTTPTFRTNHLQGAPSLGIRLIYWFLQPVLLLSALTAFYFNQDEPAIYLVCLVLFNWYLDLSSTNIRPAARGYNLQKKRLA